jgi:hypothetical protein
VAQAPTHDNLLVFYLPDADEWPYGPRPALDWALSDSFYWLWSGFFGLVFIVGLLGALYRENWSITEQDIVVTKSVGPWRRTRRVPRAPRSGFALRSSRAETMSRSSIPTTFLGCRAEGFGTSD